MASTVVARSLRVLSSSLNLLESSPTGTAQAQVPKQSTIVKVTQIQLKAI